MASDWIHFSVSLFISSIRTEFLNVEARGHNGRFTIEKEPVTIPWHEPPQKSTERSALNEVTHSIHQSTEIPKSETTRKSPVPNNFFSAKMLPVGVHEFEEIVRNDLKFVDKSMLIADLVSSFYYKALLITRPRGTGKSICMSMLRAFLDNRKSKDIFKKTEIFDQKDFCENHQNKNPVIYLTFVDFDERTYEGAMCYMKTIISELFCEHEYLRENLTRFSPEDNVFRDIMYRNSTETDLEGSITTLSKHMFTTFGVRPYIIFDDYDMAIFKSYTFGYFEEMLSFKTAFYNSALKVNCHYTRAILTGVAETTKADIFSGLSNILVDSVLDPILPTAFGFTDDEVEKLISDVKSTLKMKDLKEMYNGYVIGGQPVYNAYSVVQSLATNKIKPFWETSALMSLINNLMSKAGPLEKAEFQALLSNRSVQKPLYSYLVYSNILKDINIFWSLLVHSGYLNAVFSHDNEHSFEIYNISIPNLEVSEALRHAASHIKVSDSEIVKFYEFLENGNVEDHYRMISDFFLKPGSFHEWGPYTSEEEYHTYYCGLFSFINRERFDFDSNREAGLGRYDCAIYLKDAKGEGKLFGFKKAREEKDMRRSMQDAASEGMDQALTEQYLTAFSKRRIKRVLIIAASFFKKMVAMNYTVIEDVDNYDVSKLKFTFLCRHN